MNMIYLPPEGYFLLADDAVVKDGDMYWSSAIKNWSPCCDSCGNTVEYNKQQYYFKAAARKITTMTTLTLEEQIAEAKHKVLVLELKYKNQQYQKLLDDAAAEGWKVGAVIDGYGEEITKIFVVDADNYQSSSGNVEKEWLNTRRPFVVIKYGCYTSPASMLKVRKEPIPINVYGYQLKYSKKDACVVFGCAHISIALLRAVVAVEASSNRKVVSIKFDSDKSLTRGEIEAILEYVDYTDKQ